jgi:hypothetical protein
VPYYENLLEIDAVLYMRVRGMRLMGGCELEISVPNREICLVRAIQSGALITEAPLPGELILPTLLTPLLQEIAQPEAPPLPLAPRPLPARLVPRVRFRRGSLDPLPRAGSGWR